MPKEIDVSNVSSMIDLKAELYRKQQKQAAAGKPGTSKVSTAGGEVLYVPSKKPFLVDKSKSGKKKKVESEERRANIERLEKEMRDHERQLSLSRKALEAKAKLYDKLASGQAVQDDVDDDDRCLVNFDQKMRNVRDKEEEAEFEAADLAAQTSGSGNVAPGEEWVEYTDSLGRVRTCMTKDLHKFVEADKRLQRDATGESDERRDKEEEIEPRGPVHYQHVARNEAWDHGVAYFKFAENENERQEQMQELDRLRKQTIDQRNRTERLKEKRKQMMQDRLAKVKKRKNLNEDSDDDDDAKVLRDDDVSSPVIDWSELAQIPMPDESVREEQEERERRRDQHVRPWDRGKKTVMSQERWIDKRRDDRPSEFAPPMSYTR